MKIRKYILGIIASVAILLMSTLAVAPVDTDYDGLTDEDELNIYHTNPNYWDTDGDYYSDGVEVDGSSDPLNPLSVPACCPGPPRHN